MKKYMLLAITIFAFSIYAQQKIGAIKAGMFFPQACDGGFGIGLEYGLHIDKNLDVALGLDWFKKEFTDKEYVGDVEDLDGYIDGTQYSNLGDVTIYDFPLMLSVTAKFPIGQTAKWFATGGLGAEMLYASLTAYDEDEQDTVEESVLAFDFNWRLGGGSNL